MSFDLDKFTAEQSVELLNLGKKTDLLNLAKHYKLSEIKSSMRKHEIKNILVQYFVDEEIFNENALSLIVDIQSVSSSKDFELKFQIRQLEIQESEKEREWKEREKEREREEREKEREREREREEREKEREFQLKMREIEMQERANQSKQKIEYNFDVTKHIRLVPPFQEKEVDKYFLHFEKVAENLNWPKEHWTLLLQSVLIGKAREIYTQLGVEQSHHYETVKELILKGYELVPEAYRQKFRNCKKDSNQTHVEFARNKEQLFDRWCCSKKIDQNYDKLRQLVLVEEFKRCIQSDVKTFLDEKQVETLEEAARLADDYYLTHKVSFIAKPKPTSSHPQNKFMSGNSSGMPSQSNTPKPNSTSETKSQYPLSRPTCNYCKKPGHLVSECLKLKRKLESDEAKPTGLTTLRPKPQSSIKTNTVDIVTKPKSDSTMKIFEPFMLNGFVSLSGDNCPPTPIKILRDTGASQSLILADILPFPEKTSSGTSVLIQGVECGTVNIPLHHVNLSSDLVTGLVVIGITPSLPFKGIHLLLGNDLAGDKVVVNPLVTDTPNIGQTDDPIEQEIPDLYPSCAVTRAMAKNAILKDSNFDNDLTDTFIGQYFNNEIKKSLDPSLSDTQTDSSMSCHSSPRSNDQGHDTLSKSQLIQEQQTDPEISKLFFRALPEDEISCFELVFGHSVRGPLKLLKEKFLSNDETPLNLLQYVSDFRNRLSRACEVARSNLKTSQGKMKARYDNHVIDRKFKPGDEVLALLPIPGRPLQARYFGPYTIDKKTSDLNYIINTPGRRKNKQMCHVNMLKEYFDRDSSISKPITVVNTVPQESNVFEPEVNSDFIDKSDPGPSKLENSDILRNLNNKLSHLEPSQQEELKQLIHEYEHLFPDIPTRTDKIYHDVIVEDSKPIKQHPYRMNPLKRKYLQDEVK